MIEVIKKNYLDVSEEEVTVADSKGATIRWLITDKDGAPRYTMRRFDVKPGGKIGLHVIPKSMKFMSCQEKLGFLTRKANETVASPGDVLFVPPYEKHGYENLGKETFTFLCVIPILKKRQ